MRHRGWPAARALALLVVAGDPQVLRGMKYRQDAAAIARLRNLIGGVQFEQRRQNEPEKLREGEGERGRHRSQLLRQINRRKPMNVATANTAPRTSRAGKRELRGDAERKNERIGRAAGFKACEQHQVGRNECDANRAALSRRHARAAAPHEHHQQAVVLAGVVPGAPANVKREHPRKQPVEGMQQHAGQNHQQRDVQGDQLVFLELRAGVVGAVDRRHEVRIVEENGEEVERHGPGVRVRRRHPRGDSKQRRRPRAASHEKIEPRAVNPLPVWQETQESNRLERSNATLRGLQVVS
jgi:hypothetical protein